MRSEMKKDDDDDDVYIWTEEDLKRASAPTRVDFARFNAMWEFDHADSQLMSREEFADIMYESARDVGVPEKLKKKISEISNNNNKEKKKKKIEKSNKKEKKKKQIEKSKKNEKKKKKIMFKMGLEEIKKQDKKMMLKETYAKEVVVYDPEDPKVQAEQEEKLKEVVRRLNLLQDIMKMAGTAAADAAAKAAVESEDPSASLAQAAAKLALAANY